VNVPRLPAAEQPVIAGFSPDPTVCRAGSRYYLANSSFEYFPGAPIFESADLLDWSPAGNILSRRSQFARGDGRPSGGIFGSTLRFHDGRFWFITTNMSAFGGGHLIVHAEDPSGPWSEPTFTAGAVGIDPDLAWDEDGTCYLTWCGFSPDPDQSGIMQSRLDLPTGRLLDTPYRISSGSGLQFPEGPHLYRRGGYWYLLLAEGGTERGHAVTIARGPSPTGPFEPHPGGPIFSRRSSDFPVQNTGHADLVELEDGTWAVVYLGARPRGSSPGFHVLGRETFLAGVDWVDDWPVFVPDRFSLPTPDHSFDDDFAGPDLDVRWVVPAGEADRFVSPDPDGGLELRGSADAGASDLLCARVRDLSWEATAEVDLAAGPVRFVLRLDDRSWYAVEAAPHRVRAVARAGDFHQEFGAADPGAATATLSISSIPPAGAGELGRNLGPDEIVLAVDTASGPVELARLDGRYVSTEVAGGFTGRMLGVGALGDRTRLLRFAYRTLSAG
jgi:hypothetical protein